MFRSSVAYHRYTHTRTCTVFLYKGPESEAWLTRANIHTEGSVFVYRNKQAGAKRWYTTDSIRVVCRTHSRLGVNVVGGVDVSSTCTQIQEGKHLGSVSENC